MNRLPPLFLSHGSPMIALEPGAAGAFMQRLGPAIDARFGRPRAVLALSAHTVLPRGQTAPVLLGAPGHEAIHDFGPFDPRLDSLRYDTPGDPALAGSAQALLGAAGIDARVSGRGGLDHGIWTALRYLWPLASVPVVPMAWPFTAAPRALFDMGRVLAPLAADGVLVLATGSITHNLRRVFSQGPRAPAEQPEIAESAAFRHWLHEAARRRDWDALFDLRQRAPHALDMHPTDEHLLPWYLAAGAGGREHAPVRLHDSVTYGSLGMDAYAFGSSAAALAEALAPAGAQAGVDTPAPDTAPRTLTAGA